MPITPVSDLVAAAKAEITTLSMDAAQAQVDAGEAVFVDIRDVRELQREGKVPGAVHAPRGMLEFWIDPASPYHRAELATDKTLILYCGGAWRSALAAKALQDMGVENVAEMDGGFAAWKAEERPIETKG
ncbi:rhodanese-like domain-containing protein [Anianabacter salinae]|uniref:rhodanese-like domain-containing protein n=1 Tax=Anianabacter salinae TaxID=2851023 RepID=UPI00225E5A77|nr:rhodanese-like domain-containing protein [Anianabacter salinae]MBV0913340.1 rhodanese-like domain-containing protein [Anianabacter salinae]